MFRIPPLASQPLLFIFLFLAHVSFIYALPTPQASGATDSGSPAGSTDDTIIGGVIFRPEPYGRGTVGIIFSCTATYIFCVWTAMHPNIHAKCSNRYRLMYKIILMVFSIFIPVGLIIFAFGQWEEARRLRKAWEKKFPVGPEHSMLGMDGAFFVVMGGFLVDEEEIEEGMYEPTSRSSISTNSKPESLPDGHRKIYMTILTPTGFHEYLHKGWINNTSFDKREIQDKSKTSTVAKVLAFSQALWLVVQSCARWGQNLPLSILEVHVLIQVLCTIVIYIFWWYKPLDVAEPIKIKLVHSPGGTHPSIDLTQKDQRDEKVKETKEFGKSKHLIIQQPCGSGSEILAKAIFDLSEHISEGSDDKTGRINAMVIEGVMAIVVGGLHLSLWNVQFPTSTELLLWRICAIGMVLVVPIEVIIASVNGYGREISKGLWVAYYEGYSYRQYLPHATGGLHDACNSRALDSKAELGSNRFWRIFYTHYALVLIMALTVVMYDICTIYIVVESYISMRAPRADVFTTPRWNDYWPHL